MAACKTCGLPEDLRATVEQMMMAGVAVTDIRQWLQGQGQEVSRQSLDTHKLKHLDLSDKNKLQGPEVAPEVSLGDPGLSSGELHLRTIREMAAQIDRLKIMTQVPNLRTERLLSEALFRLHQALSEVSYD